MPSIVKLIKNPAKIVYILDRLGISRWIPDKPYLKLKFRANMGKKLNLENPQTFNEKLQWLKLYDRKMEYTTMVDKYEAKHYVAEKIGEEYIIPTLGIWNSAEDIEFDYLPQQFVLKCTHDSGGLVICREKAALNRVSAIKKIKKCLKRNFFYTAREWPYKNIHPRIIMEQFLEDGSGQDLMDYKVMCFGGQPKLIQIHRGRSANHTQDYYDINWNKLDICQGIAQTDIPMKKPEFLEEMLRLSSKLSAGVPQLRVDWYYVNRHLYFGELTFFDGGGFFGFKPEEWDYTLGTWIELPSTNKC